MHPYRRASMASAFSNRALSLNGAFGLSKSSVENFLKHPQAIFHTQAESGAFILLTGFLPSSAGRPFIDLKPPHAIGSVSSLSVHAIAYRWRSLPRVRRHRASKPQGSSERVLPWQVTIIMVDQLICASLSLTYCYTLLSEKV